MNLHNDTFTNRAGKIIAKPISRIICSSDKLTQLFRVGLAYGHYLIGQGAGKGAGEIDNEIDLALTTVYRSNPVVFDVGGNVGNWVSGFKKHNRDSHVYVFEPQPLCLQKLRSLDLEEVTIIPCAVSDQPGKMALYSSVPNDGSASLHERGDSYFADRTYKPIEVDLVTLDSVASEHELEFIDFVKFDIEGHEFHAMKGFAESLDQGKIGALSFEFGSGCLNSGVSFRDFWNLLSEKYFFSMIAPGGSLRRIDSYYEDLEYYRGVTNFILTLKNHPYRK